MVSQAIGVTSSTYLNERDHEDFELIQLKRSEALVWEAK
jgi:hypothetical protein